MSNGLALLANYENSSEEEEEVIIPAKKKKLPNPIKEISVGDEDCKELPETDDPSLHDFRVRSFPHVRGNWASFVYVDPLNVDFSIIQQGLIDYLKGEQIDAKAITNPHLSISRVVTLQYHWISSFTSGLQEKLGARLKPFRLRFGPLLKILVNEEATRTFISIEVQENRSLLEAVQCCDESLTEFNKEPFYSPPEFHISLLWCLNDQRSSLTKVDLQKKARQFLESLDDNTFEVSKVNCKVGNKLFALTL